MRPGDYRLAGPGRSNVDVNVALPKAGGDYRPDRVTLLQLGADGKFDRDSIQISSGQSIVVHCAAAARLRVKLVKAAEAAGPTGRDKVTVNRQKPRTPPKPGNGPRRPRRGPR